MKVAYTIRVDITDKDGNQLGQTYEQTTERMRTFLRVYDHYLIAEEVADVTKKIHYQGILWINGDDQNDCDKNAKAMRKRFSTSFPAEAWKAGKDKSSALVKNIEQYQIYICKQQNIVFKSNYTDEDIEYYSIQSFSKTETIKNEKKKTNQFFDIVYEKWLESTLRKNVKGGMRDRDNIKAWLIEEFYCLGKLWDTPVITKYTNYLEYDVNKEGHTKAFLDASRDRY